MDVAHAINSVERKVGTRTLASGTARTVTLTRTYDTSVEDLWSACTERERIQRWFVPVSGDLRAGGRFQVEGNAAGTIERCDPPRSFAATWEIGGETSWIELRLSPAGAGRTRLELEHIAHVDDERWTQYGPGAVGVGWDLTMLGLALHLASGKDSNPAESEAWAVSEEGKQFISMSSEGWRDANIASGADRVAATAAADRTHAFYTGS